MVAGLAQLHHDVQQAHLRPNKFITQLSRTHCTMVEKQKDLIYVERFNTEGLDIERLKNGMVDY